MEFIINTPENRYLNIKISKMPFHMIDMKELLDNEIQIWMKKFDSDIRKAKLRI